MQPAWCAGSGSWSRVSRSELPTAGSREGSGQSGDLGPLGKKSISRRTASCPGEASVGGGYQRVRRIVRGRG